MALTRVQATPPVSVASATTVAVTFGSPPSVSHGVIVAILNNTTASLTSVVDNQGNTYSLVTSHAEPSLPDLAAIYACPAITSTGTPFTITATGPSTGRFAMAFEASGPLAVDQTTGSNGAFPTAPTTGTTAPVTGADLLMVALIGTSSTVITVGAASPTWTQEAEDVASSLRGEVDSRSVTSAAGTTHAATWTLSGAHYWTAALAVFQPGAAAPAAVETAQPFVILPL
jgi:hypothetical protein